MIWLRTQRHTMSLFLFFFLVPYCTESYRLKRFLKNSIRISEKMALIDKKLSLNEFKFKCQTEFFFPKCLRLMALVVGLSRLESFQRANSTNNRWIPLKCSIFLPSEWCAQNKLIVILPENLKSIQMDNSGKSIWATDHFSLQIQQIHQNLKLTFKCTCIILSSNHSLLLNSSSFSTNNMSNHKIRMLSHLIYVHVERIFTENKFEK